jgi:hypothetical protein
MTQQERIKEMQSIIETMSKTLVEAADFVKEYAPQVPEQAQYLREIARLPKIYLNINQ